MSKMFYLLLCFGLTINAGPIQSGSPHPGVAYENILENHVENRDAIPFSLPGDNILVYQQRLDNENSAPDSIDDNMITWNDDIDFERRKEDPVDESQERQEENNKKYYAAYYYKYLVKLLSQLKRRRL